MEEKQLTSRELEEQANALLAEADFEEINLPKKAKKAAAAKKANEDTAQAEKPAEKYPPLDEKLVASLPAACGKWFDEPTTKLSNVYFGFSA